MADKTDAIKTLQEFQTTLWGEDGRFKSTKDASEDLKLMSTWCELEAKSDGTVDVTAWEDTENFTEDQLLLIAGILRNMLPV